MKKEFKISIIIVAVSFIIALLILNSRAPSFSTGIEKSIAEYPLPEITFTSRTSFSYSSLVTLFEISKKVVKDTAKPVYKLPEIQETPLPLLSFIYEGRQRYAIIGDIIVREGDTINGYQVKSIFKDRILIKDRKGKEKWLKLQDY